MNSSSGKAISLFLKSTAPAILKDNISAFLLFYIYIDIGACTYTCVCVCVCVCVRVCVCIYMYMGFSGSSAVNNPPSYKMQELWVPSLGWEDPLEEEMATHSSILAWEIPWTEKPSRLQSMGSQE